MALLSKHGRGEEALFYATLVEDYDRVLAHHASHGPDHKAALEVLKKVYRVLRPGGGAAGLRVRGGR